MTDVEGGELRQNFYQIMSVPVEDSHKFRNNLDSNNITFQEIKCTDESCIFFVNAKENLIQGLKGINGYQFFNIDTSDLLKVIYLLVVKDQYSIDSIELLSNIESKEFDHFKDYFYSNNVNKLIETVSTNNLQLDKIKFTKNDLKFTLYNTGLFISNLSLAEISKNLKQIFSTIGSKY
jgi:hypothetical protein